MESAVFKITFSLDNRSKFSVNEEGRGDSRFQQMMSAVDRFCASRFDPNKHEDKNQVRDCITSVTKV